MKCVTLLLLFLYVSPAQANMSLASYLNQVKKQSFEYQQLLLQKGALKNKFLENQLPYFPVLSAQVDWTQDQSPRTNPVFQGDESQIFNYFLALSKKNLYGGQFSLKYGSGRQEILGANPSFLPINSFYRNYLRFEFSQSLWRNAFGYSERLKYKSQNAASQTEILKTELDILKLEMEAENSFWALSAQQQILEIQKESLGRAKDLLTYNKKRNKRGVVDHSDVLQAQAAYDLRKLEYEDSKQKMEKAWLEIERLWNAKVVRQKLEVLSSSELLKSELPTYKKENISLRLQKQALDQAKSRLEIAGDTLKPDLKFFGSLATGSLDPKHSQAFQDSWTTKNPTVFLGLNFSVPLAFGALSKIKDSYRQEYAVAKTGYQKLELKQNMAWKELLSQLESLRKRIEVSKSLLSTQKKKLEREKQRQKKGRSSTFQVLNFEQDYLRAQLRLKQLVLAYKRALIESRIFTQ